MRAEALALFLLLGGIAPVAAAAPADADAGIHALIDALATSPCKFQRNGSWYDGARAAAHLQRKYDYLRQRDQAGTPEQFIERAASRSSVSGRAYRVACPGQPEQDAAAWFQQQLQAQRRHRAGT
ncbi:hypothetical protein ARC20_02800 [Stenotrophomonas panacihumi]|uniref:DUF5329 domain-containing protein n=1 Tax=Stenotrophomonas panacihumi TaxID=676599 RepID=A0A0R0B0I0_9GAMM|nr:DUF5329 domain-containing protein [Stenotrophomonas panacihumi]KRG47866.1 hypothetical protein ARC20_02800 [Stenotrophomonas panacihumi]PTN55743.1 hypothetical protein C9J98_03975 [Stenotrophomonas panacihumi]